MKMIILVLPFAVEHPDVQAGFDAGKQAVYRETRPETDMELVQLVRDCVADSTHPLQYHVGFLFGLYATK